MVQEIDAYWWMPKAQYSWGLDLSQTLQGAGGIGGLLAMHVPADQCAAIGGGASAMSFQMPGSLAGLATAADRTADGLAIDGSVDSSGGGAGEPVGILERLSARRDALRAAGLLGGTGGVSESTQTQIDGGEVQTLTTGGDCDFWYLYDANGNVGQLLRYDAGTSAVSLAAAYEYDPYGNTLVVRDIDNSGIAAANKYRFSTKRLIDELAASGQGGAVGATGLYYYGYRFYSPGLGRWISRDPIEEEGGVNVLGAFLNNAVCVYDPDGRWIAQVACGGCVALWAKALYDAHTICSLMPDFPGYLSCVAGHVGNLLSDPVFLPISYGSCCCCYRLGGGKSLLKKGAREAAEKVASGFIRQKVQSYEFILKRVTSRLDDLYAKMRLPGLSKDELQKLGNQVEFWTGEHSRTATLLDGWRLQLGNVSAIGSVVEAIVNGACPL